MKVGIIIQARTSSARLPGKVLKELPWGSGITVLEHVIRRVKRAKADAIIVATTVEKRDDPIVRIAKKEKVSFFRGSRNDVLARYYFAAKKHKLGVIVRITSDCPCADPKMIDRVVATHRRGGRDYTCNDGFPRGFDVEAISFAALEKSFRDAREGFEREHVTYYARESAPRRFKTGRVTAAGARRRPDIRVTLDTEEDYALLCAVFEFLYRRNPVFGVDDVVRLFKRMPWLALINGKVAQKRVFKDRRRELVEAVRVLDRQDLKRARDLIKAELAG